MSEEIKNIFINADKVAGKESKEYGTDERKEQEKIAKEVKILFENFTESIIENISGWDHCRCVTWTGWIKRISVYAFYSFNSL